MNNCRSPVRFTPLLVLPCLFSLATTLAAAEKPNIIVILADDVGFSDLGCYGGEIATPNLDKLAAGGLRFTQFYNTARCCPTRASLLTGLYPHQAGVGHMTADRGLEGYRGDLNRRCATIAEALGPAGYAAYMVGKWHVTKHMEADGPKDNWPRQRGFDRFYGTIVGGGNYFDPAGLVREESMISAHGDPEYKPKQYYYTDAISDHAVRFLDAHQKRQPAKPFFLYVAYTAAHWPMHALEEDIAKQRGKYDAGYQPIRQARFERMKQLGLVDNDCQLSPAPIDWQQVEIKDWEARCMEVYAAMVDRMDQGIGRIVEQLRTSGQLNNTLVLYLQDNGGCAENVGRDPNDGPKTRPQKPPFPPLAPDALRARDMPTRDGYPVRHGPGVMPGPGDTHVAYGKGWANVSNTPFREYKHWVHEGGIATPLIAHWPQGISRRGDLERQPGHLVDLMATCLELAGAEYPRQLHGEALTPLVGRSLRAAFEGQKIERDAIYWEHEGNRAIRQGRWKLVAKGSAGQWELYDIESDRSELHDLAADKPELAARLAEQWERWAKESHVLPWIWGGR